MMYLRRISFISIFLAIFLCGCLEIDVHTKMESDGSGKQVWKLTTSALLAQEAKRRLESHPFFRDNHARIWDEFREGDYILFAEFQFDDVNTVQNDDMEIRFEKSGWLKQTFSYTETWKRSFSESGLLTKQAGGLIPARLNITVEMPGKIIHSNADQTDGSTARWSFPITDLVTSKLLQVESESWNWNLLIFLLAFPVVIFSGLIFLMMSYYRKAHAKESSANTFSCPGCGFRVSSGSIFCNSCGKRLAE